MVHVVIKRPLLVDRHRRARLAWCLARRGWNLRTWRNIHWSDESRFLLHVKSSLHSWEIHPRPLLSLHCKGQLAGCSLGYRLYFCVSKPSSGRRLHDAEPSSLLTSAGLESRRVIKRPLLADWHRRTRLAWCLARRGWNLRTWRKIHWSAWSAGSWQVFHIVGLCVFSHQSADYSIVVAYLTSNSFEGHPCCMHADYLPSLQGSIKMMCSHRCDHYV
jgi:hypothetical protein